MCEFQMNCYLIVKSDTSLIDKKEFENWYANEHLSEAKRAFKAKSAKRGWIKNTNFHVAMYEFENHMQKLKSKSLSKKARWFVFVEAREYANFIYLA